MNNIPLPTLFSKKEECCGCAACCSICSRNAISMQPDEEGFLYPEISDELCIRCLRCVTVCPVKASVRAKEEQT